MKSTLMIFCASLLSAGVAMAQAPTQTLAEPQITHLMKVANEGEIDTSKLAKKRASSEQVKVFAKKMVDVHETNEKEVKKLSRKKDIGMDRSDAARDLKDQVKKTVKDLKDKKAAEFDKAYIASQVEMHQGLLTQIEGQFLPAAKTPELKEYLTKTRDHVKMHLDEAKSIQATLQ